MQVQEEVSPPQQAHTALNLETAVCREPSITSEILKGDGPEGSKSPSGCRQRAALACQLPPKNQGGPQGSPPPHRSPRISPQRAPLPSSSLGSELFTKRSEPSGSFNGQEFLDGALLGVSVLLATSLLSPLRP